MSIMKESLVSLVALVTASMAMADTTLRLDFAPVGEIDPAKSSDYADTVAVNNLYDTLIGDVAGGGIGPVLASKWTAKGKVLTFTLRDGITFSSGNPLTAQDVVFSVDRFVSLGKGYSWLITSLDTVKALDSKTVQFTLKRPDAPFLSALKRVAIVDSKTVKANGEDWLSKNSAGTGAYVITSHNPQNLTVFKKNTGYWGTFHPKSPDTVRMRYGLEPATVRASIVKGTHDLSSQWLPPETLKALNASKKARIVSEQSGGQLYIKFNTARAPFDDVNCRLGVSAIFDYAMAIKMIAVTKDKSLGSASNGTLPAGIMGHDASMPTFKQDKQKAKAYLDKCKYDASKLDIELSWIAEVPLEERFALLLQSNLKSIGVKSHVKKIPWTLFTEQVTSVDKTPHITQIFVSSDTGDADALLYQQYHSSAKGTWAGSSWFDNAEVDSMLEKARAETDVAKRTKLYKAINKKITALAPAIFAYDTVALMALNNRVTWPALEDKSKAYGTSGFNIRFNEAQINK